MNFIAKKIHWIGILLLVGFTTVAAALYFDTPDRTRRAPKPAAADVNHVCPMHPEVTSARAGDCPKCGMALVPAARGKSTPAGCSGEGEDHDCCGRNQATHIQLPPGHPPIPGFNAHSGCPAGADSAATTSTP